ncbi:hypothetical protein GA0116948_102100 [Chitinophaga costaii]|uniref:Solute:sodium symporter small subunit n=1 Tax=Chitinophaga costaii TaxID=1335309 RepID=A0A1C4AEV8_9BACT|nr:hypothetical protein [Chitinophaga costaii]PUZ26575.1 hypothetical protein DCM91_09185 [Chitinophaga costaii]SCB93049.1 hypothetical protein GA0116948_102100 [Chitinophaga costaii]
MTEEEEKPQGGIDMRLVRFFSKIIRTVFIGLFWMMVNVFIGLYLGYGLPDQASVGQLVGCYIFFGITLVAYLYYVYRLWRDRFKQQP